MFDEVKVHEIVGYLSDEFFLALRFWKRYKRFGIPGDWRDLKVAQIRVIELFDDISANRGK
jgi:hypothetical protein